MSSSASDPPRQQVTVSAKSASSSTGPPRVLLVDDDRRLLRTLNELLTEMGIAVVGTATDGAHVLAAISEASTCLGGVDVVVLDVRMPIVDGLTATREVKRVFPGIAVILHTAYAGQLAGRPHDLGAFAEIAKGGRPADLIAAINAACSAARSHALPFRSGDQTLGGARDAQPAAVGHDTDAAATAEFADSSERGGVADVPRTDLAVLRSVAGHDADLAMRRR